MFIPETGEPTSLKSGDSIVLKFPQGALPCFIFYRKGCGKPLENMLNTDEFPVHFPLTSQAQVQELFEIIAMTNNLSVSAAERKSSFAGHFFVATFSQFSC